MFAQTLKIAPMALFLSVLTACGGDKPAEEAAPKAETAPKVDTSLPTYKIGVETPYMPYVQLGEGGHYEGFDVDLLTEIGKREGFNIAFEPRKWDGILDLLDTKELDIVASGVFDTPERRSKYGLSVPYHSETVVLVVGKDSNVKTFEDAKSHRIAYIPGSVLEDEVRALQGKEPDPSLAKDGSWQLIKSIIQKEVELGMETSSSYEYYAKRHQEQGLRAIYQPNAQWTNIVFAVKQDNTELLDKLNKGIASVKADGTYDKIKGKWFANTGTAAPAQ